MTIEEHINFLKPKITPDIVAKKVLLPVAKEMVMRIVTRIADEGKASDMSEIGQYSEKPAYFNKNQFAKKGSFKAIGKDGNKTKKSMFVEGGYKQLRVLQNLRADRVNSQYSGVLLKDYKAQVITGSGKVAIGFTNFRNAIIRQSLEKKYKKKIYSPTAEELAIATEAIKNGLKPYIYTVVNVREI